MNFEVTPDLLERHVSRRFNDLTNQGGTQSGEINIDQDFYIDLLRAFNDPKSFKASDFSTYSLSSIILYLKRTHELYRVKSLQDITMAIARLDRTDHVLSKLQVSLNTFFAKFKDDLESHIQEEESELLPYIKSLIDCEKYEELRVPGPNNILADFTDHHNDHLERDLYNLTKVLNAMAETYKDSFAFRMLVNRMSIFELDLRIHGKIEEEVLIPKAFALEKKVYLK